MIRREILTLILLAGILGAAPVFESNASERKLNVFVSILPQAYFVERVGGDNVNVEVLVGPGQSPATYEINPRQMALLTKADVFFRIGVPFEEGLIPKIKAIAGNLLIVDTREGIELRMMEDDHRDHRHGEASIKRDPHIWLDPVLVKRQAVTICDALKRIDPQRSGQYDRNLKSFQADLDSLNEKIKRILAPIKGSRFYVFHPAYGYFGDRYGLKQVAVELEGKEPGAADLARFIEQARRDGVRVIFVQPQFSEKSARTIADALKGAVVPLDPLARNYIANMENMAELIRDRLKSR
jgi:zinc transport system substrate-binding protein